MKCPSGSSGLWKACLPAGWASSGEESAGSSFLRRDGTVWTTDKDGIIPCLLSAEITARTGKDPGQIYRELTRDLGDPVYERIDAPATPEQKAALGSLSPSNVNIAELAGEKVQQILTAAPGDGNPIGGIKVIAKNGWFAARPFRYGRDLQDLRREFSRPGPPATHPRGSADNCSGDARAQRPGSGEHLSGGRSRHEQPSVHQSAF